MKIRSRPVVYSAFIIALFVIVAYSRWNQIRNWFDRERVDPVALAELEKSNLSTAKPSEPNAGWPQWRGPNRDGVAPAGPFRTDLKTNPPKQLWTAPCGGGYGQPIVVDGKLYLHDFADGKERLRCLDTNTGDVKWDHSDVADYTSLKMGYASGPRATPTIHDGRIYTVGATGLFHCFELPKANETNPKLLGKHELLQEFEATMPTWGVACSPLIVNDTVVVQPGGKKGSVAAFSLDLGEVRWKAGSEPSGYSSPILANSSVGPMIIAVMGDSILGISDDDGRSNWKKPWVTQFNGNIATPISVGDYVFVSSNYGKGCSLFQLKPGGKSLADAKEVYFRKNRVMSNHHSTCVYRDGYLYGFDGSEFACVDLKKGERVPDWHAADDEGKEIGKGSLTLVGDNLLGITERGTLFLGKANSSEFTFLGQIKNALTGSECWTAPVVVDGRMYIRDAEKIVCYDVR